MRRIAAAIPRFLLLLAVFSCSSDTTGPSKVQRASLSLAPGIDRALLTQVGVDRVVVRFTRTDGTKALESVVAFPATSDTLTADVSVPLNAEAESFDLTLLLLSGQPGDTVFQSGPVSVVLRTGASQPIVSVPPFVYVGPGANAIGVRLVSKPAVVGFGQTATFTAEALDASGTVVPKTPIFWSSSDAAKASVPNSTVGAVVGGTTRGSVTITASLLPTKVNASPPAVSSTLVVQPAASALVVQGGSGQSGTVGTALGQPLRVRVNAADNLGVQGVPVTFTVASGGGSLGATQAITDVNGDASITWTLGGTVGTQTVTATVTGVPGATQTLSATAVAGPATKLAFTTQPSTVNAGAAITPAVVVEAQDSFGNTATSFAGGITMALGSSPAGATLSGTATVTAVNGVARFGDLAINTAGSGLTLTAASGNLTGTTSAAFAVNAGPAATLAFTTQPSNGTAGSAITPSIVVTARDASGNTATSFAGTVTLALGANPSNGTLSGTTTATAVNGVATFAGVTLAKAGAGYTLVSSATGLPSATSSAFNVSSATASTLVFTTQPSSVDAGSVITPAVVVEAQDSFGNTVTSFTGAITMTLGTAPGGATLGGTTTVSAVNGIARYPDLTVSSAGSGVTLAAASSGLTGATSTPFTVRAGSATTLVFTTQPSNGTAGSAIAPSIVVTARDGNGNTATSFVGSVSLALGANPGGSALSGTTTVTAANGVATFSGVSLNKVGAGYTLVASGTGVTSATSSTFSIAAGAASTIVFTTQPSTVDAGVAVTPAVVVEAQDSFGNTATSFTGAIAMSIASGPGGETLGGTTTVNAVNGVARYNDLTLGTAGTVTLSATSSGLTAATSSAFTVNSRAAASLVFTTQPSNATAGTAIAPSIVVTARDAAGATATTFNGSVSLALGANPGGGTLSGTTTVTAVNGVATFSSVTLTKAGIGYTLVASATGLPSVTSGTFNIAAAAASALSYGTQPSSTAAGSVITPAVTVRALDTFGNVATAFTGNVVMTIGTNPGSATLSGTTTVAAVAGVATFSNLSLTARGTGYTLAASATGVTSATSTTFDITATTLAWTNPSGGSWSNPANWSLARVPQAGDSIVIAQPGTYTVTLDTTFTGATIVVGGGSGTQTLSLASRLLTIGGTLTVKPSGAFSATSSTIGGAGALVNQGALTLKSSVIATAGGLDNQGTLIANAAVTVNGTLTTSPTSLVRLLADGSTGFSTFTSASGFTNNGSIEMTTTLSTYSATLAVSGGNTLLNAPGGTINSLVGTGGTRTIDAQLNNQGTITVAQPLTLTHANAAQTNAGTIDASAADFAVAQSGSPATFTNTGSIIVGGGHVMAVGSGSFIQNGTLSGAGVLSLSNVAASFGSAFALPTLNASGGSLTFATDQSTATTVMNLVTTSVNGPGAFTNATGQTLNLRSVVFNTNLNNQGTLITDGASGVGAGNTFTTATGSTLRLVATGSTGNSTFTTPDFTNNGAIEMTTTLSSYTTVLAVSGTGVLTNAAEGTITTLVGTGGSRTISAQLVNQGFVTINQPLVLARASSAHSNSGTIDATNGDFTVNQNGSPASFDDSGSITVGAGHVMTVNGGTFAQSGSLTGAGALTLSNVSASFSSAVALGALNASSSTLNFATDQTTAGVAMNLNSVTVNNPSGTNSFTNVAGQTLNVRAVTFNMNLVNQGTLISDGASGVGSGNTFTAQNGSLLHLEATGSTGNSTFTVPPFTNNGSIELTTSLSSYTTALVVSGSGTLTNSGQGKIYSLVGAGGTRTLSAELANNGFITVNQPLVLSRANSAHVNAGTIDATNADFTVNQSGTPASFSNAAGVLTIGPAHVMTVNGGSFAQNGVLNGGGTLTLNNVTTNFGFGTGPTLSALNATGGSLAFTSPQSTSIVAFNLNSLTVSGPSFTNATGQTMNIRSVVFNTNLTNQGTLITDGASGVNTGFTFTTASGSLLRLIAGGSTGNSTFTTTDFTNLGAIELTTTLSSYTTALNVSGPTGALTNGFGATISSLVGAGGTRTIGAQLNNQGTVTINQPLTLSRASASHVNSNTINATNADLTINQAGAGASFDNSNGAITVGAGHTLSVTNGSFNIGDISGSGALSLNGTTATFGSSNFSLPTLSATGGSLAFPLGRTTANTAMNLTNTTVVAPNFTNVSGQTLTVSGVNFNTNLINQGLLVSDGPTSVTGGSNTYTNAAGSTLLINATGSTGNSTFSAPSFTNDGSINMTTTLSSYTDVLTVGGGTGTLTNSPGGFIQILTGTGGTRTLNGTLDNFGTVTVHPGPNGGGTLQVNGAFNHRASGVLNLELGGAAPGSGYSRLSVRDASFVFQGFLNFSLVNAFTPTTGNTFDILTANSVGGTFTVSSQPPGWGPGNTSVSYPGGLVRLTAP